MTCNNTAIGVVRSDSTGSGSTRRSKGYAFPELLGHTSDDDSRFADSCCEACEGATIFESCNNHQICLGWQELPTRPSPPSVPEPELSRFGPSYRTRRKRCGVSTAMNDNKKFALITTFLLVASLVDPAWFHCHLVQPFWRDEHFTFPAIESTAIISGITNSSDHRQYSHARRFLADSESCSVVEECRNCDSVSRSQITECQKTGRIERWKCGGLEGGEKENQNEKETIAAGAGTIYVNRSCTRTKAEEEFLMVRLQVICVLIGSAAFVSVRKQRVATASLFDQRKLGIEKRRRRDSSLSGDIEMTGSMEETIPLTEDAVDIV